ncbi:hypothetical protein QQS21_003296 [Conoideocrella luteorostrata]|uniref:Erythromycin biosynthesis protein CIII-like C-terminal domain-containing protein n=1 Tax=Conoideocrella luteorostrata TaxID=1105319 RepID=A0AAJ0CUD8_9HYPO|nr:hypothetical protein QQS21_003296 [Conoideocrella luteorostrata]
MQAVSQALVARGHTVLWLTSSDHQARVLTTGAQFVPTDAIAAVDAPLARDNNTGLLDKSYDHLKCRLLAQVADYRAVLANFAADALLVDVFPHAARALCELGEIPVYATLGVIPLYTSHYQAPLPASGEWPPTSWMGWLRNAACQVVHRWIMLPLLLRPHLNQQRRTLRLRDLVFGEPAEQFAYSPSLHIQASSLTLEFGQVPKPWMHKRHTIFVGPLVTKPIADAAKLPPWWSDILGTRKRVVGITQGTLATDPTSLIIPSIEALQADPCLILVVVSPYVDDIKSLIGSGTNVQYATWLPYDALLPRLSLLITNGGYGSITQAISHGVPLLCAGQSEDKRDTAARVTYAGVGIDLKTDSPSVESVREAAQAILRNETYRSRAQSMSEELNALGGAEATCDALEELVRLSGR